jgi:hypothetical protein
MELVDEFLGIQVLKTTHIKLLKPKVVHCYFNYLIIQFSMEIVQACFHSFLIVLKWLQAEMRRILPFSD